MEVWPPTSSKEKKLKSLKVPKSKDVNPAIGGKDGGKDGGGDGDKMMLRMVMGVMVRVCCMVWV